LDTSGPAVFNQYLDTAAPDAAHITNTAPDFLAIYVFRFHDSGVQQIGQAPGARCRRAEGTCGF
jgi:hypothetical protein